MSYWNCRTGFWWCALAAIVIGSLWWLVSADHASGHSTPFPAETLVLFAMKGMAVIFAAVAVCFGLAGIWLKLEQKHSWMRVFRRRVGFVIELVIALWLTALAIIANFEFLTKGQTRLISRGSSGMVVTAADTPLFFLFYGALWFLVLIGVFVWLYVLFQRLRRFGPNVRRDGRDRPA